MDEFADYEEALTTEETLKRMISDLAFSIHTPEAIELALLIHLIELDDPRIPRLMTAVTGVKR
ncbi:hypothetical protein [Microbacterium invictum]|uniref:Uncharacterized protein n=1 Tax=Microbacterium invictum TaxID=515415 RepID=A0ABZ0VGA5_9MICO|nr:hypothetical protein [Microbacterium invictum]WQB71973.1 hypothetical protein T9R20_08520 [Microbacterium invictum]